MYVARSTVEWVLAIGAARYGFLAAGWMLPWMRRSLPPRYWRKVVAATQGVVLTFAAAQVLPLFWTEAALAVSLALLAESFGRDVRGLWRHRRVEPGRIVVSARRPERSGKRGTKWSRFQTSASTTSHSTRGVANVLTCDGELHREQAEQDDRK